jgi:hypothetical protein
MFRSDPSREHPFELQAQVFRFEQLVQALRFEQLEHIAAFGVLALQKLP